MSAKRKEQRIHRLIEIDLQKKDSWIKRHVAYLKKVKRFHGLEDVKQSEAVRKHFGSFC